MTFEESHAVKCRSWPGLWNAFSPWPCGCTSTASSAGTLQHLFLHKWGGTFGLFSLHWSFIRCCLIEDISIVGNLEPICSVSNYNSSFPESRSYESLKTVFSREVYSQIRFIRLGCMSEVLNILLESWAQMCQTNCTQAHSTSESPAFRPHRKLEAKVGVGPRTGFHVSLAQDEHSCLLKRACHAKLQV